MNPDWFADRLKELREGAGLSQQALADRSGMTREGVAQLETRRRKPSWESVVALCQALGVGCDAFTTPPADRPAPGPGRPRKAPGVASARVFRGTCRRFRSGAASRRRGQRGAGKGQGKEAAGVTGRGPNALTPGANRWRGAQRPHSRLRHGVTAESGQLAGEALPIRAKTARRIGSGRSGHASTTRARSGSVCKSCVSASWVAPEVIAGSFVASSAHRFAQAAWGSNPTAGSNPALSVAAKGLTAIHPVSPFCISGPAGGPAGGKRNGRLHTVWPMSSRLRSLYRSAVNLMEETKGVGSGSVEKLPFGRARLRPSLLFPARPEPRPPHQARWTRFSTELVGS